MSPPFDWWPPDGPWPSTPGGIRGPDGRTLTDLYNQLNTLMLVLGGIGDKLDAANALLSILGADVQRLIGPAENDPAGWLGLANYLRKMLGAPPVSDAEAIGRVVPHMTAQRVILYNLLVGSGYSPDEDGVLWQAMAQFIAETANRSTARFAISSLSAAVGSLGSEPADQTVKQLLDAIRTESARAADCCEDNAPPPGGGDNPPPEVSLCENNGVEAMVRVTALIPITEGQPGYTAGVTRFGLDFGSLDGTVLTYDGFASGEANIPTYLVDYGGTLTGCIEWDLTGNNAPPWTIQTVLVEQVGGVWSQTYASDLGTVFDNGHNSAGWDRSDGVRFAFRLEYTGGEGEAAPGKNFWLSYGPGPS